MSLREHRESVMTARSNTFMVCLFAVQSLVQKWAPLVFLAPGEKFFPSSVSEFLNHMIPIPLQDTGSAIYENPLSDGSYDDLPKGRASESWYLTSRSDLGEFYCMTTFRLSSITF